VRSFFLYPRYRFLSPPGLPVILFSPKQANRESDLVNETGETTRSRGAPRTGVRAAEQEALCPAVLDAIRHVIEAAHRHDKPASVCGEMAGDPAGALALLGMEADSLSKSPASLSRVKLVVRSFTRQRARALLDTALEMDDGFAIHRLLHGAREEAGV
jgi:signal transduction protein with GAF and PtsI domain